MPVICEKPIADTLAAAKAMAAKAEETGLPCAIIQNYRYAPNKQEVVRIREGGATWAAAAHLRPLRLRLSQIHVVGQGVATRHGF